MLNLEVHHVKVSREHLLHSVLVLSCHLSGERSDNVFIMDPPPLLAPATPVRAPKQEAGMLGFHDANEVKTWQCVAGSLWAAPDLRPPSHQDQSLIPLQPSFTRAYYAQECLSLTPSLITPSEAGMWGAGVNFGQIPSKSTTPNNTQPPPTLFFLAPIKLKLLPYYSLQSFLC